MVNTPEFPVIQFYLPGFSPEELRFGPIIEQGCFQRGKTFVDWARYQNGRCEVIFESPKYYLKLTQIEMAWGKQIDPEDYINRLKTANFKEKMQILKDLQKNADMLDPGYNNDD